MKVYESESLSEKSDALQNTKNQRKAVFGYRDSKPICPYKSTQEPNQIPKLNLKTET